MSATLRADLLPNLWFQMETIEATRTGATGFASASEMHAELHSKRAKFFVSKRKTLAEPVALWRITVINLAKYLCDVDHLRKFTARGARLLEINSYDWGVHFAVIYPIVMRRAHIV
ncbi:hypothetical protein Mal52_11190 [Symmachiella dynata]|uniref:Uncharacterized protein n=1 Tax=Symmachiella dynata TaxID=2527995 RepID=A0A517ZJI5_9PLAN|nr:hypothetical protein Mal52_11190 [Symmachiella dynata]